MENWKPITLNELNSEIERTEADLPDEFQSFWKLVKINPVKWVEKEYGDHGGGFWVVAICENKVIYYNDIEDGFNISNYKIIGNIDEYWCNQDELNIAVKKLYKFINFR